MCERRSTPELGLELLGAAQMELELRALGGAGDRRTRKNRRVVECPFGRHDTIGTCETECVDELRGVPDVSIGEHRYVHLRLDRRHLVQMRGSRAPMRPVAAIPAVHREQRAARSLELFGECERLMEVFEEANLAENRHAQTPRQPLDDLEHQRSIGGV